MKIRISTVLASQLNVPNPVSVELTKDGYRISPEDYPLFGTTISPDLVQEVIYESEDYVTPLDNQLLTDLLSVATDTPQDTPQDTLELNQLFSDVKLSVNPSVSLLKRLRVAHRTHYIKLSIDDVVSLRYYLTFDDRVGMQGKWSLWNHLTKETFEVNKIILKSLMPNVRKAEEVIGRRIHNKYQKLITDLSTGIVTLGD
jgi:hypothetical protein